MTTAIDPIDVDRRVGRLAREWQRWRRERRTLHDGTTPFGGDDLARQTVFDEVGALPASDPLREPLRAWLALLVEERVNLGATAAAARERYAAPQDVSTPREGRHCVAELLAHALADEPLRAAWLAALTGVSGAASDAVAGAWERRAEIRRRLWRGDAAATRPDADVVAVAGEWLDLTEDAARNAGATTAAGAVSIGLATGARGAWPARPSLRTVVGWLDEQRMFAGLDLRAGPLPAALAPASVLRVLARVGAAFVDAAAPADQPFCIAHDPRGLRRRVVGALFAALPGQPAFAFRVLDVDRGGWPDFERAIARAMLVASRVAALRVVASAAAQRGRGDLREAHESLVIRVLGAPLGASTAGVLPRIEIDDGERFAGWLLGDALHRDLVEAHDEDWFRNPRAADQLRSECALPPLERADAAVLRAAARRLAETLVRSSA